MANEHALTIWRRGANMSQADLADKLGVSRWMVNRIETGDRRPSLGLAERIANFTGGKVSANDFIQNVGAAE